MKVALAAEGTRGDIYPVLALARTLQAAGHGVRLCVPPDFETEARATGAEFVSLRTEVRSFIQEGARAVHGGGPAMAREMLRWGSQALANQFAVLPEAVEGCGYVFGAGTILAGASAAELHRIPYSPILFTPAILPSGSTTPAVLPFQLRSPRWNRLLWSVVTKGLNWALRRPVGRERARLGLPHISDLLTHVISPRPIMAVDAPLAPMADDCPYAWVSIRCLHPQGGDPLPEKLERFLDAGPPPLYVGFGSMPDPDPALTTRRLLEAVEGLGCRAILSSGWAGLGEGPLPESVMTIGPVAHARLFPRVAAVVHHGGSGTTHSAARAGVPQVIVPHVLDQFYFAGRVRDLGVGVATRARGRASIEEIMSAAAAVMDNEWMADRARDLGEELAALGPVEPDVDRLLGL